MSLGQATETLPQTLWGRFERAAERNTDLTILGEGDPRSLASVFERAACGGSGLVSRGVGPGSRVGALANTSWGFVLAALSTWAAGATFVSLPPPPFVGDLKGWRDALAIKTRDIGIDVMLLDDADPAAGFAARDLDIREILSSRGSSVTEVAPTDPALIQFSSGSTSEPRAVLLSHAALISSFEGTAQNIRLCPGEPRMLSWLPLFHDLGFINYLSLPMALGLEATVIPTKRFLRDPVMWLQEISDRSITHSPAPNFAYGIVANRLEKAGPLRMDLSGWCNASSGGEAIDVVTLERFARATAPFGFRETSFVPGYGLAEATCIVSVSPPGRGLIVDSIDRRNLGAGHAVPAARSDTTASFVSTGPPIRDCEVAILRDGALVEEREVGEILVKTPTVMDGYVGDPEATAKAFWNGWLRTGDLGYLADGEVYVTGRSKDLLVLRGQNVHPEDIERLLLGVPGLRPGGAVALAEGEGRAEQGLLIVAETRSESQAELQAARSEATARIWKAAGLNARILLVAPGSIPKTSSGKLRRRETWERIQDGSLSPR